MSIIILYNNKEMVVRFMNLNGNKSFRVLNIYERLNKGEVLNKKNIAQEFNVSLKTIQRDIDDLRLYLAEMYYDQNDIRIKYDKVKEGYYIVCLDNGWFTNEEVMALCKILLESRAFCKEELDLLIDKLVRQVTPNDQKAIKDLIVEEQFHYVPLQHGKKLLKTIWELSRFISKRQIIEFSYRRQDGKIKERKVKPVAVMFSEFYFYLIAYLNNTDIDCPTIFRIDRIENLQNTGERFTIPYAQKFNQGEFSKRVQFMYAGELKKVDFTYSGDSIEAVLDRLPTAIVNSQENGVFSISAEVYGNGIYMWLRSQGDYINIIERN